MTKHSIGIAGMGIMGAGMAQNFLKQGHEVYVWNRSAAACARLAEAGATQVETPAELCQAQIVFEVTANDESSRSIWTKDDGILASATSETVCIASSTLSVAWTDELADLCAQKQIKFLDIPLTGSRVGAESGTLTLLAGGDKGVLDSITQSLESISETIFHFGPAGHGTRYKLILNAVQAIHTSAFGEALRVAKDVGMDTKTVGDALAFKPGGVSTTISNNNYQNQPDPVAFGLGLMAKDVRYAKAMSANTDSPYFDLVAGLYAGFIDEGHSEEDFTYVNEPQ